MSERPVPGEIAAAVNLALRPTDYPRRWLARRVARRIDWISTCCKPTLRERACGVALGLLCSGQFRRRLAYDRKLR